MALNPIGAGASVAIATGVGKTSSAFDVRSNAIRLTAVGSDCHVKVASLDFDGNDAEKPTASDFYIASGNSVTLQQKKASQIAQSIESSGSNTIISAPEGTQWPFGIGDYVGLTTGPADSNWNTLISYAKVTDVWNGTAGPYDSFQAKLTLGNVDSSGISTAYIQNAAQSIYRQNKVCTYGGSTSSAGCLHYQQVQISGDA